MTEYYQESEAQEKLQRCEAVKHSLDSYLKLTALTFNTTKLEVSQNNSPEKIPNILNNIKNTDIEEEKIGQTTSAHHLVDYTVTNKALAVM